jgi:hypothetical protein
MLGPASLYQPDQSISEQGSPQAGPRFRELPNRFLALAGLDNFLFYVE